MINVYVYVLDTLADWELGYVTSELNSGRFFKANAEKISVKTVSCTKNTIKTMGGLTIQPDCLIEDIEVSESSVLLLPGANTWSEPQNQSIIDKAKVLLEKNTTVCAICGATVALANAGILDNRPHTSNGEGFLDMFCPSYKGKKYFINEPSVTDKNLITASCTGNLLWAKQIINRLNVFSSETLDAWYNYFSIGDASYFYALMNSLPKNN